jgi:phosphoglycerate dehydrogenase-like enzyme
MSETIRLLVADDPSAAFVKRLRQSPTASSFQMIIPKDGAKDSLLLLAPEADAILCYKAELPASLIRAATSLKFIQKHGLNCNNIDVAAATERNVLVATMSLMRNASVAEHALAHMLACARKIIQGHRAVTQAIYREKGLEPIQTSQWNYRKNWAGIEGVMEVYQATVGIIGMGDIGMEIAKRCHAFGMTVYYYDKIRHPSEVEIALGIQYLPFDKLLTLSDFVVLILPHTPESEGLIGAREFELMKPSATIINVSRGGLVDEAALISALQSKRIAMAGLDVYRMEPLPVSSLLMELPNVVLTPHTGGGSYRFADADLSASLQNIQRFFRGERPNGIVNALQGH